MFRQSLTTIAQILQGQLRGNDDWVEGVTIDSRTLKSGQLFVALHAERDGHHFVPMARLQGASAALVERWVDDPLPQIRVVNSQQALQQLACRWRDQFQGKVVGLTGSNGKTTVKEMLASIGRQQGDTWATQGNFNNELGVPLTLLSLANQWLAVIEMGANHGGEIARMTRWVKPDVALLNNAGEAHLEGFGSLSGVAHAKAEIFQGLGPQGQAIINGDDHFAPLWFEMNKNRIWHSFSLQGEGTINGQYHEQTQQLIILLPGSQSSIHCQLAVKGRHNAYNALAAATVAQALNIPWSLIKQGLECFQPVAGRLQYKAHRWGGDIIDDSYNANPDSMAAALKTFQGQNLWLVLGDMAELGDDTVACHQKVGAMAKKLGYQRLFGCGPAMAAAVAAFGQGGQHYPDPEVLGTELNRAMEAQATSDVKVLIKGSRSMQMERVIGYLT